MAAEMETTGVWLPDEGFLFNQTWMSTIKAHIRSYVIKLAHSDKDMKDESFIGPFNQMLLQFWKILWTDEKEVSFDIHSRYVVWIF